jgi:hypothetical protein
MLDKTSQTTAAWLIMGSTGSAPGALQLDGGRLSYTARGRGALTDGQLAELERRTGRTGLARALDAGQEVTLFDVPLQAVSGAVFPWYYFGGGMKLAIGEAGFRFSFLRPQNTRVEVPGVFDIPVGRASGKAWKAVFAAR